MATDDAMIARLQSGIYCLNNPETKIEVPGKRRTFVKPNCLACVVSLLVLASGALTAQLARHETGVPLKNWATPLYWQPSQSEREITAQGVPQKGGRSSSSRQIMCPTPHSRSLRSRPAD